ncbi:asparagine synthase (glutamine-hydrolysing) [Pelagirhabdus alkalitolerans]|uniref:asparagine synthase (glutamine-hydrolyzing) n=1 Tax=Pelagirhabdus alkalitolerans TaxID=1612202 RepID=A0A1G6IP44_9BACI|nr:asparagine synthase (glutamine-hydrolyzing) [Pelagirhabdus alkalitolerans]SDC08332.1 asparagine synthase (glutamine-hydrolysing) [Pelagirhabdus alkalitolerans]
MCGIVGWISREESIKDYTQVIENMNWTLKERGPDDFGYFCSEHAQLGHRRLTIVDPEGGVQPMMKTMGDRQYALVYNGELYNTEDVREKLKHKGYHFESYSDTEVLLVAYMEWGADCLKHINGIFAFGVWNKKEKELFLARDHLGVKPLFYSKQNNHLIFGSQIKALLAHPMVEPTINSEGVMEILGLGPARSLGHGVFEAIDEIPPAHYLTYKNGVSKLVQYWELEAKTHTEDLDSTIEQTRHLLVDAVERQLVSDVPLCTFLSGGLDSSAISSITSRFFEREGRGQLDTFSIDYKDNDQYFVANEFQPNADQVWAEKMAAYIGSNHHTVTLDNAQLIEALKDATRFSDLPGMADIDSSLYLFCKEVRKKVTVALSGECADEIFGGYPWFTRSEDIQADTFPWSKSIKERKGLINKDFSQYPIEEYVGEKYLDTIKKVPKLKGESKEEARMRELFYLNIKWFMITLLNRKDRMSMGNSLEVRVPFADYRLVEYAFNIPNEMKFYKGREKGLLREAMRGIIPQEIIERKKSPYPKTHHIDYTKGVQKWMNEIMSNKQAPIFQLIDRNKLTEIVKSGGASFKTPWFGQLMTGPQLIAYFIQINTWMEAYQVKVNV